MYLRLNISTPELEDLEARTLPAVYQVRWNGQKFNTSNTKIFSVLSKLIFFSRGSAAQRGLWLPHSRSFLITKNNAPHSVGLLWTSDQPVAEIST
jgi:hypothetical protein